MISEGQKVDAENSNAAWMSRTSDTNTTGKVDLENPETESGASVENAQRELNGLNSYTGSTSGDAHDRTPTWTDTSVGTANDNLTERAEALTVKAGELETDVGTLQTDLGTAQGDINTLEGRLDTFVMEDITDVDLTTPAEQDQVLAYNSVSGNWEPVDQSGGSGQGSKSYIIEESSNLENGLGDWQVFNDGLEVVVSSGVNPVDELGDAINKVGHGFLTGHKVFYSTAGSVIGGLTNSTDYYVIRINDDLFALATTRQNAYDDVKINLTSQGTGDQSFLGNEVYAGLQSVGVSTLGLNLTTVAGEVLAGEQSGKVSKPASLTRYQGFAVTSKTIYREDRGNTFIFKMSLDASDANYASGDLKLYAYDVTNNCQLAVQSVFDENNEIPFGNNKLVSTVYTTETTEEVRMILGVNSTSTLAWDIFYDSVTVGPDSFTAGYIGSNAEAYTPSTTNVTNATVTGRWRRDGQWLHGQAYINYTGASTNSSPTISLPAGLSIDTNALVTTASLPLLGYGKALDSGTAHFDVDVAYDSTTTLQIRRRFDSGGNVANDATIPMTPASGDTIIVNFSVPIEGWDASTLISTTDALMRSAGARYTTNAGQSIPSNSWTIYDFEDKVYDEANLVTIGSSWNFTAQKTGKYLIDTIITTSTHSWTASNDFSMRLNINSGTRYIYLNGQIMQSTASFGIYLSGARVIKLDRNDTISLEVFQNSGTSVTMDSTSSANSISITPLPDLTSAGVYKNEEYIEAKSTSTFTSASGVSNLTWTVIDSTFNIELTPGEWEIGFIGPVQGFSTAGSFITQWAISNSSTAGTGIITSNFGGNVHTASAADRYSNTSMHIGNYTVSSNETLYIQARPIDQGSLGTATIGYGNAAGGDVKLWARRIK